MKKRRVLFLILALLGVGVTLVSLFVPMVNIVGHAADEGKTIVYNETVSLVGYLTNNPFITTAAEEVYFDASGPIWLATGAILLNILVAVSGVVIFVSSLLEVVLKDGVSIKNNNYSRKIAVFLGFLIFLIGVFALIANIITTSMAGGYVEFYSKIEIYLLIAMGIIVIIFASLTGKRKDEQQVSKTADSLGFALSGLFSALTLALAFIPQFTSQFLGVNITSMWQVASEANNLESVGWITKMFGTYPFGISQWVIIVLGVVVAFIFIYSLIGFILTLCKKNVNWLSLRVKHWSKLLLIVSFVLYVLVMFQCAVLYSSFIVIDGRLITKLLAPQFYGLMFVPFLPYLFSMMISYNKQ